MGSKCDLRDFVRDTMMKEVWAESPDWTELTRQEAYSGSNNHSL